MVMADKTGLASTIPCCSVQLRGVSLRNPRRPRKGDRIARETFDNASDEMDEMSEDSFASAMPVLRLCATISRCGRGDEEARRQSPREGDREDK